MLSREFGGWCIPCTRLFAWFPVSRLRRLSGNASVTLYTEFWKCGTFMRLRQQALVLQSCRCSSAHPLVLRGCGAALFWVVREVWGGSGDAPGGSFHSPHHAKSTGGLGCWGGGADRACPQGTSSPRVHRRPWVFAAGCLSLGLHRQCRGAASVSCAGKVQGC